MRPTAPVFLFPKTMFVVLSKSGCSYCDKAKALLDAKGMEHEVVPCESLDDLRGHLQRLGHGAVAKHVSTFPQIVDTAQHRFVGSYHQLVEHVDEPLLRAEVSSRRFTPFPIRHHDVWDMYKKAVASFWTADEINLSEDVTHWNTKLNDDERHFIKHVLAFFAGSDGIVMENIQMNFGVEIQMPEARSFYAYQGYSEAVHSQTYGILLETLVSDTAERDRLFSAIDTMPAIAKKADWAQKWLNPTRRFAERLLAFTCVEGILFSGSFCAIFWLKQRGLMPGLSLSNAFISRDEGLHQDFGSLMYRKIKHRLSQAEATAIVREAVENEKEFITDAIPCRLIGMNADSMGQYIEFVADRLLRSLGYEATYGAQNPFPWMEIISLGARDNFFERFSSEYQKAGVMASADDQKFAIDADF